MLILSRHREENVIITTSVGTILIKVTGIGRDRVQLGFDAPGNIAIHRQEVYDAIANGVSRYQVAAVVEKHSELASPSDQA